MNIHVYSCLWFLGWIRKYAEPRGGKVECTAGRIAGRKKTNKKRKERWEREGERGEEEEDVNVHLWRGFAIVHLYLCVCAYSCVQTTCRGYIRQSFIVIQEKTADERGASCMQAHTHTVHDCVPLESFAISLIAFIASLNSSLTLNRGFVLILQIVRIIATLWLPFNRNSCVCIRFFYFFVFLFFKPKFSSFRSDTRDESSISSLTSTFLRFLVLQIWIFVNFPILRFDWRGIFLSLQFNKKNLNVVEEYSFSCSNELFQIVPAERSIYQVARFTAIKATRARKTREEREET